MEKELFLEKTVEEIKRELSNPDQRIIALCRITEKLPKNINELFEALRVVTDTVYPTLEKEVGIEDYCRICLALQETNNEKVLQIINSGVSVKLEKREKEFVKGLAESILGLITLNKDIEKEAYHLAEKSYPNFCFVAGTNIACKMLVISGSMSRLSQMPSSTIQLLGAEKALFKSIRTGSKKTPRYGLLFNHSLLINKDKKEKGRLSRFLAGKIAIAIKADISGIDMRDELKKNIEKKINGTLN